MRDFTRTGAVMKTYRQKIDKTQEDFGKPFRVHCQFVSNWERGICLPPVVFMKKIMKFRDFPKDDFINALREDLIESYMQKYK